MLLGRKLDTQPLQCTPELRSSRRAGCVRVWAKARRNRSGLSNSTKNSRPSKAGTSSVHATAKGKAAAELVALREDVTAKPAKSGKASKSSKAAKAAAVQTVEQPTEKKVPVLEKVDTEEAKGALTAGEEENAKANDAAKAEVPAIEKPEGTPEKSPTQPEAQPEGKPEEGAEEAQEAAATQEREPPKGDSQPPEAAQASELDEEQSQVEQQLERSHAAIQDALKQLEQLEASIPNEGLKEAEKRVEQQSQTLVSLREQLQSTEDHYRQELELYALRLTELEDALAEADKHINSGSEPQEALLTQKCRTLEKEVLDLRRQKAAAEQQVSKLQADLTAKQNTSSKEMEDLNQKQKDLREMAEALEAEAERLKQQLEASTEQINSLEEELQVALNTSEARAAESEALERELDEARKELGYQKSRAQATQDAKGAVEALQRELDQARQKASQQDSALEDALEVTKKMSSDLDRLGRVVSQKNTEIASLKSRQAEVQTSQQVQERLRAAEDACTRLEAEAQAYKATSERLRVQLAVRQTDERKEVEQLRAQAASEAEEAARMLARAEEATVKLAQQIAEYTKLQEATSAIMTQQRQVESPATTDQGDQIDSDTASLMEELEIMVAELDEAAAREEANKFRADEAESRVASLSAQLLTVQEAASEWAKSREVERERLANVQQMYAAAAAQAAALSQRGVELERQLHEAQMKARNGSGWRRKSEMERRIEELERMLLEAEAENASLKEAFSRNSLLLQESRRFLQNYMSGQEEPTAAAAAD